jgi:predicted acetyltransferase
MAPGDTQVSPGVIWSGGSNQMTNAGAQATAGRQREPMTISVEIERGHPDQRATLAHLAQLYMHDFNDFLEPDGKLDVGEDGRFKDDIGLESYWTKPENSVWFIRAGSKLTGFALLDKVTRSGQPADFNMAQFFVTRAYRGREVASRAVVAILEAHPGQWEIAIMLRNVPALRFWPRAIALARISQLETLPDEAGKTKRRLLRFVAG